MPLFKRSFENPILVPQKNLPWEAEGAFNGTAIREKGKTRLLYRAQSLPLLHDDGPWLSISSIGMAESADGIHFEHHRPCIEPELPWERFGCEDPRVTKCDGKYYVFYTALSEYPFRAEGITVGLAITKNFRTFEKRHITPFNAKAMTLFPERIGGKLWAILSVNTDRPPSTIALAAFEKEEDMWDTHYWQKWYERLDEHGLELARTPEDHVEIGAPPLKTKDGWLLLYSYIQKYHSPDPIFTVEALLLDLKDPRRIVGRTQIPLLVPEEEYEFYGKVEDIVFPSGAVLRGDKLFLYYGAADTTTCVAIGSLKTILAEIKRDEKRLPRFERYAKNPILEPLPEHPWEAKAVFNPAAIEVKGTTRLFYRAMSPDDTSVFGYAELRDGFRVKRRLPEPVYEPRAPFEMKLAPGNSGCEDARLTRFDDTYYMLYTAVDAAHPPRVAMTTINAADFEAGHYNRFAPPLLISPPDIDDKDACLFPEKIGGRYVILHRIQPSIDINFLDHLDFDGNSLFLSHNPFIFPRRGMWDSRKIGINTAPLRTSKGWLILYHGVSEYDGHYRVGALLLDLEHPDRVIGRSRHPLFSPETEYERIGVVPNVVFPCGAIVRGNRLITYYGGADRVIGVASINLPSLLKSLLSDGI
jgi:beta-1,2-mannobiose phosphorylase / 1,2-beta-oligomannan phosphorylase